MSSDGLLTRALRPFFITHTGDVESSQRRILDWLLKRGSTTKFASERRWPRHASGYRGLLEALPSPVTYAELRPYIMRMISGESNVLWPGRVHNFAQSSGTSDGKSKYIPVSDESLKLNHFAGGSEAVASYLKLHRPSHLFDGRAFILGGSFANELSPAPGIKVGDVSATLIDRINPLVNLIRVPDKETALMADWRQKLPALVRAAARRNDITNISGVPSWFLTVLQEIVKYRGAENIREIWPRLEVFFHGGIAFEPYRVQYQALCGEGMRYHETYNASEGFFAVQDSLNDRAMRLLTSHGVFYEFEHVKTGEIIPAWDVKAGERYALIVTSCNGLWRNQIGDVVEIVGTDPLRVLISGRTKHYINAFGEEVMVHNTDLAIGKAAAKTGALVRDYTVAPVYARGGNQGRHQWAIEFESEPSDMKLFSAVLDDELRNANSDYDAKRTGDIFLSPLEIVPVSRGTFERYLAATGRLGGQRKVPRLSNDRKLIESLLKFNT